MKFLRKINLGLILTIIVVAAVAIYSVNVELNRNKEKENIKKACEEFIDITNKYAMLPEQKQDLNKKITEQELNDYINEIEKGLKEKMVDNDSAIEIQATILESELLNQIATENIATKFEREILKISSYSFDGDQVTVSFKDKVNKDVKYKTNNGYDELGNEIKKEESKNISFGNEYETITLQKVDNTWKVVYADIQYSDMTSSYGFEIMY